MANYVETVSRTFQSGATIPECARVKLSSGVLALAGVGASDEPVEIGTAERACVSGDQVAVRLRCAPGSQKMIAGGSIAVGVAVYGAANGKISTTPSGTAIGVALEAAGADGDIIEVLRY